MLSLSPVKLLIVLVVAMILLGPDKMPQVARQMGAAWRTFRTFHQRVEEEVRGSMPDLPSAQELARMARSPVQLLNQLADMSPSDLEAPVPDPGDQATASGTGNSAWPADPDDPADAPGSPVPPTAGPRVIWDDAVSTPPTAATAPAPPAAPAAPTAPVADPVAPPVPNGAGPAPTVGEGPTVPDDPSMN